MTSIVCGPSLFNFFICDMFYLLEKFEILNYAEDSTPYCVDKSAGFVVNNLEQSSTIFFNGLIIVNTVKNHILISSNSRGAGKNDNNYIGLEDERALLVITIDSDLTFENHINSLCKKASQKLNTLAIIAHYMYIQKRRTIMKSFLTF